MVVNGLSEEKLSNASGGKGGICLLDTLDDGMSFKVQSYRNYYKPGDALFGVFDDKHNLVKVVSDYTDAQNFANGNHIHDGFIRDEEYRQLIGKKFYPAG